MSVQVGHDIFNFPNGDIYVGHFRATLNPPNIFYHGYGVYIKKNGTVYKGQWERDILISVDEIIFKDKTKFLNGLLSKTHKYISGIFYLPSIGNVYPLSFINNSPVGLMKLIDKNGFMWQGNCEKNNVVLTPLNNGSKHNRRSFCDV